MMARLKQTPAEGWISLGLVLLLTLTVAWSVDDAAWVLGRDSYTDFLTLTVIFGVVAGFAGAKAGWGRWATYLAGSFLAALVVPLYVGAVLLPEGDWGGQFKATADAVTNAWRDLAILNRSVTREFGHFLLVLGLFTWATAMYASFTTFGHRRPLNAIILIGLILVGNMAFTFRDQLVYLVIFCLGVAAGMAVLTTIIGLPFMVSRARSAQVNRWLTIGSGVLSLAFGLLLAYEVGIVGGLFTGDFNWEPA